LSPDKLAGFNFPKDEDGKTILQDVVITADEKGKINITRLDGLILQELIPAVRLEKPQYIPLIRFIDLFKKALSDLFLGKSFVDKEVPELKGKSYLYIAKTVDDNALNKAAFMSIFGLNSTLIMPDSSDIFAQENTSVHYDEQFHTKGGNITKFFITNKDTGKQITVYLYPDTLLAQEALSAVEEYAKDNYDYGIVDIQADAGISHERVQMDFPQAVISDIGRSDRQNNMALSETAYIKSVIIDAGEKIRNKNKNSYMRTSPIFSTNVDLSRNSIADFNTQAAIKEIADYGFDTVVFKLKDNSLSAAERETFKNVLKNAHNNGIKIVIEYQADNLAAYNSLISSLSSSLADLRSDKNFIDGLRLDLSKMSEADAKSASASFAAVRSALNRENVNGVFGVKSAFYDSKTYKAANAMQIKTVSHSDSSSLNLADDSWIDFSIGAASYDEQSMDFNLTSESVEKIIDARTTGLVGIDWYVVKSLAKSGDLSTAAGLIKNVFKNRAVRTKNTPRGRFDFARKAAINSAAAANEQNARTYYGYLSALLNNDNVEKVIDEISNDASLNSYISGIAKNYAAADKGGKTLIQNEIAGHFYGILENMELANYENAAQRKMNFVYKTNREVFSSALVKVKMLLYASSAADISMGVKTSESIPYEAQLNPELKTAADIRLKADASDAAKADLERLQRLLSSLDTLRTAEQYFNTVQEALNILESMTSSDEVANMPIALSQLLSLLALKADLVTQAAIEKLNDGMDNITDNIRAVLASA
jgi:hypothetical protein